MAVIINGKDLLFEEVIRVCREGEKVIIAGEAKEAMNKSREYVEKKLEEGDVPSDIDVIKLRGSIESRRRVIAEKLRDVSL